MLKLSFLEMIMMIAFGLSWPFSIYKSWITRRNGGKSAIFLTALVIGYVAGIAHKLLYSPDLVIAFYALNLTLVLIDLALFIRNARLEKAEMEAAAAAAPAMMATDAPADKTRS